MLRMFAGSTLRYEKKTWIASSSPIVPVVTSSRTRSHIGWSRYMNASIRRTPAVRHPSTILAAWAADERQWLLAQDVFAGGGCPQRPLGVQMVRQRDVHGLDIRVGEEVVVRAVVAGNSQPLGGVGSAPGVPRRDRDHIASLRALHRRDHLLLGDRRAAQHPPTQPRADVPSWASAPSLSSLASNCDRSYPRGDSKAWLRTPPVGEAQWR